MYCGSGTVLPMPTLRCQSRMLMTSGIADDAVMNTFFVGTNPGDDGNPAIVGAWETFMRIFTGSMAGRVAQTGHTLTAYDMADPEPRVPIWEVGWTFDAAPSGNALPTEVALCVSFQASKVSGSPQARRRGRLYLGPFEDAVNTDGRPGSSFVTGAANGLKAFAEDLAAGFCSLLVYSRVDEIGRTAINGWVDNAFDTQRRRGLDPTVKTAVTFDLG